MKNITIKNKLMAGTQKKLIADTCQMAEINGMGSRIKYHFDMGDNIPKNEDILSVI